MPQWRYNLEQWAGYILLAVLLFEIIGVVTKGKNDPVNKLLKDLKGKNNNANFLLHGADLNPHSAK